MATNDITNDLKYVNLQMAAEAVGLKDGMTGGELAAALVLGNNHASRFTNTAATDFANHWEVVSHVENSGTGFSGTLFKCTVSDPELGYTAGEMVMSFRSTEFIDDAARDNEETNAGEIKSFGWAFGQIADMENWYKTLKADSNMLGDQPFSVTGYSLGGHLATAFTLLRQADPNSDLTSTYTFNGAGVGEVNGAKSPADTGKKLADIIATFDQERNNIGGNISLFLNPTLQSFYEALSAKLVGGVMPSAEDIQIAQALAQVNATESALLVNAMNRIVLVITEAQRVPNLNSSDDGSGSRPVNVPISEIDATKLDYQLAVLTAQKSTSAIGVISNGEQAYSRPQQSVTLANVYDLFGDTSPSAVSNSQLHYGQATPIKIEDQPLYRGDVIWDAISQSYLYWDTKLLVPGYAKNDFGDTHSLVLMVDSLAVQNVFVALDSSFSKNIFGKIFEAASALQVQTGDGPDKQGYAKGDVLENIVNGLADLIGLNWKDTDRLRGNPNGNTWADLTQTDETQTVGNGLKYTDRNTFYDALNTVQSSNNFLSMISHVQIVALPDNGLAAKKDFGALLSLEYLTPFELKGDDIGTAALMAAHQTLADLWTADQALTPEQHARGQGNFTDQYLNDRAHLLGLIDVFNIADGSPELATNSPDARRYEDHTTGKNVQILNVDSPSTVIKQVVFGEDDGKETITGGSSDDHLYAGRGGKTADYIDGGSGNDYLESDGGADTLVGGTGQDTLAAGSGNVTLIAGTGNDILIGGRGTDRYQFNTGDGQDIIVYGKGDVELGAISIDGASLAGGKAVIEGGKVWKDSVNSAITYTLLAGVNGSQDLLIEYGESAKRDSILIQNYTTGALGVTLAGADQGTGSGTNQADRTITGDLKPIDFDPDTAGIQAHTDDLGNLVTDPSQPDPGRDDILHGDAGNDIVNTGDGNNFVRVGDGNNTVGGGAGNDTIAAGGGGNTITGGGGQDIILVGDGNNKIFLGDKADASGAIAAARTGVASGNKGSIVDVGGGNNIIVGGVGNDAFFLGNGNNFLTLGPGSSIVFGGVRVDAVPLGSWSIQQTSVSGFPSAGMPQLEIPNSYPRETYTDSGLTFHSTGAGGISSSYEGNWANNVPVGIGNDTIFAGSGNNLILASNGNNYIDAGSGNNLILGGNGNDTIFGGTGNSFISGNGGNDYIDAETGNHYIVGGAGNNAIVGGSGNDTIFAGGASSIWATYETGSNYVQVIAGNSLIFGAGGSDTLIAGSGNDTIYAGGGSEYVLGGSGSTLIYGGAGNDTIVAGRGNNEIHAGDGATSVYGGLGTDLIYGGKGDNTLYAGDGGTAVDPTQLFAGDGKAILYAGAGISQLHGGAGSDSLYGGSGTDSLYGASAATKLYGGTGTDYMYGGDKGAVMVAGSGTEYMFGAAGNNTYILNAGFGSVQISNAMSGDIVQFGSGISPSDLHVVAAYADDGTPALEIDYGGSTLLIKNGLDGAIDSFVFADSGSTLTLDQLMARTYNNPVDVVASGGDLLFGAKGQASLVGSGGNDRFYAWGGNNTLVGGSGNSTFVIHSASDVVVEQPNNGNNTVISTVSYVLPDNVQNLQLAGHDNLTAIGNNLSNVLTGNNGNDTLIAGAGNATLIGGAGNTTFVVNNVNDVVSEKPNNGNNTVLTSVSYALPDNVQKLIGTGNADLVLSGNAAGGVIKANGGNDTLISGLGVDTLVGGPGNTTFIVNNNSDVIVQQSNAAHDLVLSSASYTLSANLHNLTLTGGADLIATGNNLDNLITANDGNDTLIAGTGDATLIGGAGLDTFQMNVGMGNNTAIDTSQQGAIVQLQAGITAENLKAVKQGDDLLLQIQGTTNSLRLKDYYSTPQTAWTIKDAYGNTTSPQAVVDATAQQSGDLVTQAENAFIGLSKARIYGSYLAQGYVLQADGSLFKPYSTNIQFNATEYVTLSSFDIWNYDYRTGAVSFSQIKNPLIQTWSPEYSQSGPFLRDNTISINVVNTTADDSSIRADQDSQTTDSYGTRWLAVDWKKTATETSHVYLPAVVTTSALNGDPGYTTTTANNTINAYTMAGTVTGISTTSGSLNTNVLAPSQITATYDSQQTNYEIQKIMLGAGDHTVYAGNYTLVDGGSGNNTIYNAGFAYAGTGNDTMLGGGTLMAGSGDDVMFGGRTMIAGSGNDQIFAADGDATININNNSTGTTLIGGTGSTVSYDSQDAINGGVLDSIYKSLGIDNWAGSYSNPGQYFVQLGDGDAGYFDAKGALDFVSARRGTTFKTIEDAIAGPWKITYYPPLPVLFQVSGFGPELSTYYDTAGTPIVHLAANDFQMLAPYYAQGLIPKHNVVFGDGISPENLQISWGQMTVAMDGGNANDRISGHTTMNISWGTNQSIQVLIPRSDDQLGSGVSEFDFANGTKLSMAEMIALAPPAPSFDPAYSTYSDDGQGNTKTSNFDASDKLVSATWLSADGTSGTDNYSFDASDFSTVHTWTQSDGSHGVDIYNADQSSSGTSYAPDGSYDTYSNGPDTDSGRDRTTASYDSAGVKLRDDWQKSSDGSYGSDVFNANGVIESTTNYRDTNGFNVSSDTITNPDGSYQQTWTKDDGSNGSKTGNADGSYSTFSNDGQGDTTANNYSSSGVLIGQTVMADHGYNNVTLGDAADSVTVGNGGSAIVVGNGDDLITLGSGINNVTLGSGTDKVVLGKGTDTLQLGGGNDTVVIGVLAGDLSNNGQATVVASPAGASELLFANANSNQLWFQHSGNDLDIGVIGTSFQLDVSGWYGASSNHSQSIVAADGKTLTSGGIDALVSAMASFNPPVSGATVLPDGYQSQIQPVIAANWR